MNYFGLVIEIHYILLIGVFSEYTIIKFNI